MDISLNSGLIMSMCGHIYLDIMGLSFFKVCLDTFLLTFWVSHCYNYVHTLSGHICLDIMGLTLLYKKWEKLFLTHSSTTRSLEQESKDLDVLQSPTTGNSFYSWSSTL